MRGLRHLAILVLFALPLPAAGQATSPESPPPTLGIPEALRGAWIAGDSCARPDALLFLTARAAARIPAEGEPALLRFGAFGLVPGGWTLGVLPEPDARRLLLRSPGPDQLETADPATKTRDDRLPGEGATLQRWRRCPQVPAATAARHAEGVAALAALEHVEAACGAGAGIRDCLAAAFVQADVTGDGALSPAELARMARGQAWVAAIRVGRMPDQAQAEASALEAARRLLAGLDYDGDGRLSLTELVQDRAAFGAATGTAMGRPGGAAPDMAGLRGLVPAIGGTR